MWDGNDATLTSHRIPRKDEAGCFQSYEGLMPLTSERHQLLGLSQAGEFPRKLQDIIIVALNAIYLKDLNFLLYFSFINTNST